LHENVNMITSVKKKYFVLKIAFFIVGLF